jgi:hypothetical protein
VRTQALLCGGVLCLSACAPTVAPPPVFKLDCRLGYEQLAKQIATLPDIQLARAPGEPYHYFNSLDGQTSYVVTLPGGSGHPAVIEQRSTSTGMVDSGCAFGDKSGYDELIAYLESLNGARHQ